MNTRLDPPSSLSRMPPNTPAAATIEPTDRSMPAVAITNVMPIARTPTTLACVSMLRMLAIVGNVSGRAIAPTTNSRTTTIASAYSCSPESAAQAAQCSCDLLGEVRGRRSGRPRGSAAPAPSRRRRRPPRRSAPSRITRIRLQMPTSSWSSEETTSTPSPLFARSQIKPVELGLGRDVDAARRLVEQEHAALAEQPPREHDLLLVAAREQARDPVDVVRDGVERAQLLADLLALGATLSSPRLKRPRSARLAFLTSGQSSSRPWDLRSSGARPSPAAIAADGRPGGSRRPSIHTSPSSGRSMP